jgi:prepilin-type N-terminal cleavage/methylation domain-containing protein
MIMPLFRRRIRIQRRRRGFTLAEVVVAMTLLSVVLLSMARMSMVVSTRGRSNAIAAKRTFVLIEEANKFGAMPYATLVAFSTADATITAGDFTYTRRLARTISNNRLTLKIAIVPAANTAMVDSVWVNKAKPAESQLSQGC